MNMSPAAAPAGPASMAYDAESDRVILFGGCSRTECPSDETWAYDFNTNRWTNLNPAKAPSPRSNHAMAYDSHSDRVILFGGCFVTRCPSDETWAYDFNTNTWTKMSPVVRPNGRYEHAMAYDSQSDRTILFGGGLAGGSPNDETWAYDFSADRWTNTNPSRAPSARRDHALAYDSQSDRVVMFGGQTGGGVTDETWAYDLGANVWTKTAPSVPSAPQDLQAAPGVGSVNLTWKAPASEGGSPIIGYRIYRGTSATSTSLLVKVGNVLNYTDSGLTNGVTYYYQVSAVNAVGEGPPYGVVSATPLEARPREQPFPWLTAGGILAIILFAAALVGIEHTRLAREDILQRKVRLLMYEYAHDHPGASFSAIRDALGLRNGVAAYHLGVLEKQGLVHSESRRRHRWYYPNGDVSLWRDIPLSPLQRSLLGEVRRRPGMGIRELARTLDRHHASIAYNAKGLAREGLLRMERVRQKVRCFPTDEGGVA